MLGFFCSPYREFTGGRVETAEGNSAAEAEEAPPPNHSVTTAT